MKLFGFGRRPAPRAPSALPAGVRAYAIGDVHGRLDVLTDLLAQIRLDDAARTPAETHLVLLGDLIDRGPQSRSVLDLVGAPIAGFAQVHLLMGNHEEMLLRLIDVPEEDALAHYLHWGGTETLRSYGVAERLLEAPELVGPARLMEAVPPAHRALLQDMKEQVRLGDYLFVHAGIRPGVPLEDQVPADLRWIRAPFLHDRSDHGVTVVHGHTISAAAELRPNRIGIDTGAYASGVLTALGLEGTAQWLLATAGPPDPIWEATRRT